MLSKTSGPAPNSMKIRRDQKRLLGELVKKLRIAYKEARKREVACKPDSVEEGLAGEYANMAEYGLNLIRELKGVFKYL